MDKVVVEFIQALRHHGLPVSPAETLDALHGARLAGIADRQRLKMILGMTLAKTLAHRGVLDNLFDAFFSPQEREDGNPAEPGVSTLSANTVDADYQIQSPLGRLLSNNETAALQRAMVDAGDLAGTRDMKIFLQKNRVVTKMLLAMGDAELQHELHGLESAGQHLAVVAKLASRRQRLVDKVKDYVEQQYLLFSAKKGQLLSADTLHKVKLKNIDHIQQQHMATLVNKIARKLASLHSRRRKIHRKGLLDVRKTIAANAAFDGYLYHTRWKSTRIERPRVMVICDISGSVSQVSRFFLLFLYSLQDVIPGVRSFVFSNEMVEVTNAFKTYDLESSLNVIMDEWANRPTDYGRALADFTDLALKEVNHKTQLIMVGDARNNFDNPRTDLWRTLCSRAQRVLWLNPEDRSKWNTGDSVMRDYGACCSLVEHCSSLRDMERVLGRLLKYAR